MGFFKFLKRDNKKDSLEELDLPPAPPPLEGFDEKLDFNSQEFGKDKISGADKGLADFNFSDLDKEFPEIGKEDMDFPSFSEFEDKALPAIEPIKAPLFPQSQVPVTQTMPEPVQEAMPIEQETSSKPSDVYTDQEHTLFGHERKLHRDKTSPRTIYVRVDKFKAALGSINLVRNDLKKSEDALTKMESIKNSKDKSFEKLRANLDDLQKKLIFVDKTLFKGE